MAKYYVAQSGSNSGSGTLASPWRTISYAIDQASASNTIIVLAGTYTERLIISKALTIQAQAGATVWVQGNWTPPAGESVTQSNVPLFGDDGITNQGGELVRMGAAGTTLDGINLRNWSGTMIDMVAANCTVKNLTMTGAFGAGIIQIGADNATVTDVIMSRISMQAIFQNTGQFYYRDGTDFQGNSLKNVLITGHPHVVGPRSSGCTWTRVTILDCYGEGFSNYTGENNTWDDCTISNNNSPALYVNWSPGLTVKNCRIYFTDGFTRLKGAGGETLTIGDEVEVDRVGSPAAKPHHDQTKNVNIYNNIFVGFQSGLVITGDESKRPANAENVLITNNTFIARAATSPDNAFKVNRLDGSTPVRYTRTWSNIRIENNVFIGRATEASGVSAANKAAFLIRNNYFSQTPPSWMTTGDNTNNIVGGAHGLASTTAPTLLAYGATTQAAHDDFDATDYALTAGSALISAGIANAVNGTDYNGATRSTYDIGAIEYDPADAPGVTLVADFTLSSLDVIADTAITITDASTISAGAIDAWDWDYKLTSAATWTDHSTSSTPANLTISTAGNYQLRLTVTDTDTSTTSTKIVAFVVRETGSDDPGTCTGNVLNNADFASGTTSWSYNSGGGSGSFSAGSGYAEVAITTPASNLQLYQNSFAITEGATYRLAFKAKASAGRNISVFLFDHSTIQNLGVQAQGFSLTTEWAAQEHIFTATASSSNARLQFRPGWPAGTVYLDDVCLAPYTAPSAPESVIVVPTDPAPINVEQTLSGTTSTGSPTAYSWSIDGVEVGTASTYAWTPTSPRAYTISLTTTNAYGSDTSTIIVNAYVTAASGGTVAQLLRATVPGATGSDGGTDHTAIGTTGGVLMLTSGASTLGTAANDARIGIGGTDGTNHRAIATHADHGVTTTNTRSKSDQATAYLISPTATVVVDGDVALTDADTTTVTWGTVESGDLYALLRIAATNAAVGDFVPGGTAITVGFQPDIVFVWATRDTADFAGTNINGLFTSFGWCTADGQRSIAMRSTDGGAATGATTVYSQSYAAMVLSGTAVQDGIAVTLTATGFSHTTTGTMTGKAAYMALKLDGLSTQIIDLDTETSTGTKSYAVAHVAGAAVAIASLANVTGSAETGDDASAFSVGFWDGTNSRAVAITDDDAATTTVSKSHAANALLLVPAANGTDNILATVDDATSSTFVLNYTGVDATARKASILIIEQAAGSLTDIDYLQPGIATGTIPGMP